ncbi:TRAP transporter small permease [Lysinibacillus yapensis]|uniref:TRAP transporter small permease n=1 Tax=Ureibacillus yapensis TaxID=2304605 RepID=A0A396SFJ0_9BACL|nr:TRAP transporter small permease [Lysinibacillus yapensis]RHW37618.1 TRAP transporter small permease [Lysinibacillus yapensis]
MNILKKVYSFLDRLFESITLLSLILLVLVVSLQVVTRYVFNFVYFWSEEITLLLLVWFGFMGIAIGFREYIHLGIDSFTNLFPKMFNKVLDKVILISVFAFGIYLVVQGWQFTLLTMDSTLAATKLPSSVNYIIMPVTGFMICLYTLLHFFHINTAKYKDLEEGM